MRIKVRSNELRVQSLATPVTFVTATGPPAFGGTQRAVAALVGVGAAVDDDAAGVELDEDDEHAASAPTRTVIPVRRSLRAKVLPPIGDV